MTMKRSKINELKTLLSGDDEDVSQFVEELKEMMDSSNSLNVTTLRQNVSTILSRYGFVSSNNGYSYLREAIVYKVKHSDARIQVDIYPAIVEKLSAVSTGSVEKAIRDSIEKAWDKGCPDLIELTGYTVSASKGRPTNGEFIALIADYIKQGIL